MYYTIIGKYIAKADSQVLLS